MKKGILAALAALLLTLAVGFALGEEAEDLTSQIKFKSSASKFKYTQMTNGVYTNYWYTNKAKHNFLTFNAPAGKPIHALYLCFKDMPDAYEIQVPHGEGWRTVAEGDTACYHALFELKEGASAVRVYVPTNTRQVLGFNCVYAFGKGDLPDWVQRWEPPLTRADILFFAAHPDDDLIFYGGAIPTCVDAGRSVQMAYMTYSNTTRRSELLNALWSLGVRNYPVIGPFSDSYQKNVTAQYKRLGGEKKVEAWVRQVIDQVQPRVIVAQDLKGEYGHPMHQIIAETVARVDAQGGGWNAQKLYLHLYSENQFRYDWERPLDSFGGKTGIELADYAYRTFHVSQKASGMSVAETGVDYDNHVFGLYRSSVGPDEIGGDFFEHIFAAAQPAQAAAEPETADAEPEETLPDEEALPDEPDAEELTDAPEDIPAEDAPSEESVSLITLTNTDALPAGTDIPEEVSEPSEEAPEDAAEPAAPAPQTSAPAAQADSSLADYPELDGILPALNAKGFVDEGEFVWSSEEKGLYVYISPTLRVIIRRSYEQPDKKHPFYCFTAHIWSDVEAGELSSTVYSDPANPRKNPEFIGTIAQNSHLVFATSTDYYTYRAGQKKAKASYHVGIEVRNGEILWDDPNKKPPSMPNYETLAFYRDGHLESWLSTEKGAQAYIDEGAYDVYCFGPCLVRDGAFTDYVAHANESYNPRYAYGMIEPGHYVAMLCEGRLARSKGVQMAHLAQMLLDEGCQIAVNLDGGQTAVMCFMGVQLNQVVKTDPKGRKQVECLAFGRSDQVGTYKIEP